MLKVLSKKEEREQNFLKKKYNLKVSDSDIKKPASIRDTFFSPRFVGNTIFDTVPTGNGIEGTLDADTVDGYHAIDLALVDGWNPTNETWTYASNATHTNTNTTYSCTITVPSDATTKYSAGMYVKFTQSVDGVKYGRITNVTATVLTVFLGEDYDLDNAAITLPFYSTSDAPFDLPLEANWKILTTDTSDRTQASPGSGTWYNLGSIDIEIPVGIWKVIYQVVSRVTAANAGGATQIGMNKKTTLSTANNSESDSLWTFWQSMEIYTGAATNPSQYLPITKERLLDLSATDIFYLNGMTTGGTTIGHQGALGATIIRADLHYK